jgi:hypothetical protein
MARVIHRYQGFETREGAKRFVKDHGGYLLDPMNKRSDRVEYMAIMADGLDTENYPIVVVWNETVEE